MFLSEVGGGIHTSTLGSQSVWLRLWFSGLSVGVRTRLYCGKLNQWRPTLFSIKLIFWVFSMRFNTVWCRENSDSEFVELQTEKVVFCGKIRSELFALDLNRQIYDPSPYSFLHLKMIESSMKSMKQPIILILLLSLLPGWVPPPP